MNDFSVEFWGMAMSIRMVMGAFAQDTPKQVEFVVTATHALITRWYTSRRQSSLPAYQAHRYRSTTLAACTTSNDARSPFLTKSHHTRRFQYRK